MHKIVKQRIEFYITNVCNYNCNNCNRLNNYYFSGHQLWSDYAGVYKAWAELVTFNEIIVLGGEPTLNPTLDEWLVNLRYLWPQARIELISNGTRLAYWHKRGLFDILQKHNIILGIGLHNRSRHTSELDSIMRLCGDSTIEWIPSPWVNWKHAYDAVKADSWPNCESYDDFQKLPQWIQDECTVDHGIDWLTFVKRTGTAKISNSKSLTVFVNYSEDFVTAPLRYVGNGKFAVYHSDAGRAHQVCGSKTCTTLIRGKMYKCHHMALLPEFDQQFDVDMTNADRDLLQAYRPLLHTDSVDDMQQWINHVFDVIPQCALCPSQLDSVKLQSSLIKPKITKKVIPITHKAL